MQQIADWLKKLGMPEDIKRLAENKIDAGRTGVDLRRYRRAVTTGVAAVTFLMWVGRRCAYEV
jgi:hypothetical protein